MDTTPLDVVSVATLLATFFWSPAASAVIGPYATIVIAATTGAAWSLGRRSPGETRRSAFWFLLRINFMAILLTVTITNLLDEWVFHRQINFALVPVALAIGWVGDDWPSILGWITSVAKRLAFRWATEKGNGP